MKLEIKETLSAFPASFREMCKDPLLKNADLTKDVLPASNERILTVSILLTAMSAVAAFVAQVLTGGFSAGILVAGLSAFVVIAPVTLVSGSFISYIFALLLGYEGGFRQYITILIEELPLLVLATAIAVLTSFFVSYSTMHLGTVTQIAITMLIFYRKMKRCFIRDNRIKLSMYAMTGLCAVMVVFSAVAQFSFLNTDQNKLFDYEKQLNAYEQALRLQSEALERQNALAQKAMEQQKRQVKDSHKDEVPPPNPVGMMDEIMDEMAE